MQPRLKAHLVPLVATIIIAGLFFVCSCGSDSRNNSPIWSGSDTEDDLTSTLRQTATIAGKWTNMNPGTRPLSRSFASMSYAGEDRVVLFGGFVYSDTGGALGTSDETWLYSLSSNTWQQMNPTTKPSPRTRAALVYLGEGKVLLAGGRLNGDPASSLNDTWIYDTSDNTWTQISPSTSFPADWINNGASLGTGVAMILMGRAPYGTWVFDSASSQWSNMQPSSPLPAGRSQSAMSNISTGKGAMFLGICKVSSCDDTWVYDYSTNAWANKAPSEKPSARNYSAMAFLSDGYSVLQGGAPQAQPALDDTWVYAYAENTWTEIESDAHPPVAVYHSMAHIANNKAILFGGQASGKGCYHDTWLFELSKQTNSNLPATGITKCYDASEEITCPSPGEPFYGQDAQNIANPLSYTVNGDGTVTDNNTGLTWQRCTAGQTGTDCSGGKAEGMAWQDAIDYCEEAAVAGHTDWRLPTLFELQNLVDYSRERPAINTAAFPATVASAYWTASTLARSSSEAWTEILYLGYCNRRGKTGAACVRCVR